jgi:hypothetical protein
MDRKERSSLFRGGRGTMEIVGCVDPNASPLDRPREIPKPRKSKKVHQAPVVNVPDVKIPKPTVETVPVVPVPASVAVIEPAADGNSMARRRG